MSSKQIRITTYQITKEFIMKEKLTKKGVRFLCILGMTSPIKFETICVFLMTIEKFLQLNYSKKASCCYKPSDDNWKNHCDHLQKILTNATKENTLYFVTGDFNLNCLEFHQSSEIRQFFNNMFEKRAFPLINRPTRCNTSSATLIDSIFTNCVFGTSLKNGIMKTSISDYFAIFAAIKLSNEETRNQKLKIKKIRISNRISKK